ncbi:unnamed protein product [Linum trigynum]|uniref:Uncharacterized protein n=1 Tax=Linum trigynum TaxID=586398 RepID=A0AAV2F6N5_9ROSI
MDVVVVRALIHALRSSRMNVSMAACNTILDLSTSSAGRQRLLEFSALQFLIPKCLQIHISPTVVSLFCNGNTRRKSSLASREDQYAVSLLHVVITLVNACNVEQLERFWGKEEGINRNWKLAVEYYVR